MSIEKVKEYFSQFGMAEKFIEPGESSATVADAARALGCEPARIAKTLSFLTPEDAILIAAAGDMKIDNQKFKARFQQKARMIPWKEVEHFIGHAPGRRMGRCVQFLILSSFSVLRHGGDFR